MTCTPQQIRKLMKNSKTKTLGAAAAKAGMSENTARKYLKRRGKTIERKAREYRTRTDPFFRVWSEIETMLAADPLLEAKTLMEWLLEQSPSEFQMSQVRTLQRRVRDWRAVHGPDKKVMFPQKLQPGLQSQSDYTHCTELGVMVDGKPFPHLLFHFMLPYSCWETISIAFTESFESLTAGYAAAVQELGAVAPEHRTDNLAAAVPIGSDRKVFQKRWTDFLAYYGVTPSANNPKQRHENGSVEKSHDLLKKSLDQRLRLRGSRNFATQAAYEEFVRTIVARRNKERTVKLAQELQLMAEVPAKSWSDPREVAVSVSPWSTVNVMRSTYSVPSRLIGSKLRALVFRDRVELYFGKRLIETMTRVKPGTSSINYRHVIAHLVRKPGAFQNYKFREELFPSSIFRRCYDTLVNLDGRKGATEYLRILNYAAMNSESDVQRALELLLESAYPINVDEVRKLTTSSIAVPAVTILAPNLAAYDELFANKKREVGA